MKIIKAKPPIWDAAAEVFPQIRYRRGIIFAYHDACYVPDSDERLTLPLEAHEQVHLDRQGGTVEGAEEWWRKYLADVDFRFQEELLAHQAEYRKMVEMATCRQQRRQALKVVAERLASPFYGRMVTRREAAARLIGYEAGYSPAETYVEESEKECV